MKATRAFQTLRAAHPVGILLLGCALAGSVIGQRDALDSTWESLPDYESSKPWKPELTIDRSTLHGKVLCGYQGWFAAEGDGSGQGWRHYKGRGKFGPESFTFDYWPDMSELSEEERYPTPFVYPDGGTAHLYSPYNKKSVERHFWWMQQYGIDGVFLQRFAGSVAHAGILKHRNRVTRNVQSGANRFGRGWAVMYDLSGSRKGEIEGIITKDWKELVDRVAVKRDPSYLHHAGKPVVAVWGVGFGDDRRYTLDECERVIRFLKNDPKYGGNTVMLGVPSTWRDLGRDAVKDKRLHDVIAMADIISPWTVGRYRTLGQVDDWNRSRTAPDLKACQKADLDYMPVIWPGFTWHNLKRDSGKEEALDKIPRLGGNFFWKQAVGAKTAGAKMLYVAMFDEVDEGTQIFKVTNTPPEPTKRFATYHGLPSDHYLWLTGEIGKMLRSPGDPTPELPKR